MKSYLILSSKLLFYFILQRKFLLTLFYLSISLSTKNEKILLDIVYSEMISFHPERVYEVKRLGFYKLIQQHPNTNNTTTMIQWEITNTFTYGYLKVVVINYTC